MKLSFAGRFRLKVHTKKGELKQDTGWFDNLIVNQGLDWFGVPPAGVADDLSLRCAVGTGNTPPSFTDTQLTAQIGVTCNRAGSTSTAITGGPVYWSTIFSYQWAQGAVVGNIAEVGVGSVTNPAIFTGPLILFNHALIVDSSGNPTTISVTSTDSLSVSYELRVYFNGTDTNYSITIGGTNYSGIFRLSSITGVLFRTGSIPSEFSSGFPAIFYYTGSIGTITQSPSGTNIGGNPIQISWSASSYTIGSYTIQLASNIAANSQGAININSLQLQTTIGTWQFSISPTLVRLATQNISTTWALSWGRF